MQDDEITTIGDPIWAVRNPGKAGRVFAKADAPEIILRLRPSDEDVMGPGMNGPHVILTTALRMQASRMASLAPRS